MLPPVPTKNSAIIASATGAGTVHRARRPRQLSVKHADKLTQILETAATLFAEHGYEATSLDMLADALDMHKASLYHYVPGKEAILFLCQSRSFGDLEEVVAHVQDRSRPALERLRYFAVHLAHAQNNVFGRCLVLVGAKPLAEAAGGEIRNIQRRLDTIVRELLREGMEAGLLRSGDLALTSAMLFGALNWVPRWYKQEGRHSIQEIANAFVDLFLHGACQPDAAHAPSPVKSSKAVKATNAEGSAKAVKAAKARAKPAPTVKPATPGPGRR